MEDEQPNGGHNSTLPPAAPVRPTQKMMILKTPQAGIAAPFLMVLPSKKDLENPQGVARTGPSSHRNQEDGPQQCDGAEPKAKIRKEESSDSNREAGHKTTTTTTRNHLQVVQPADASCQLVSGGVVTPHHQSTTGAQLVPVSTTIGQKTILLATAGQASKPILLAAPQATLSSPPQALYVLSNVQSSIPNVTTSNLGASNSRQKLFYVVRPQNCTNNIDNPGEKKLSCDMSTALEKTEFECEECGEKFSGDESLKTHEESHTAEEYFCCPVCEGIFRESNKDEHMATHGDSTTPRAEEEEERLKSRVRGDPGEDVTRRSSKRPHCCVRCGARFSVARSLQIHMQMHTGAKKYPCGVCGRRYKSPSLLRMHTRTHTTTTTTTTAETSNERTRPECEMYACAHCEHTCSSKSTLVAHLQEHDAVA